MGEQLYAVVYKQTLSRGRTPRRARHKFKTTRGFRAPRAEDDVDAVVHAP